MKKLEAARGTEDISGLTMEEMMKTGKDDLKKKERHIVTWSQQEDDVLREQVSLHGTENWSIIASKFKDKTTRQCRRRWYTYSNSDFKKGGWSPDEDVLLCQAQKMLGNRWTEIAKVISGRTDNAVKNRFANLCKKRSKYAELDKEDENSFINLKNKRVNTDGLSEATTQMKGIRFEERSNKQLRAPFTELNQNIHNSEHFSAQLRVSKAEEIFNNAQAKKDQETFMKKDDPKKFSLMQQAELLSSLAVKVNTENTKQSLEYARKVLQEFLSQNKENKIMGFRVHDIDLRSEDIKDLIKDLRSNNDGDQLRKSDLHEYPASSEYSTRSTLQLPKACNKTNQSEIEIMKVNQNFRKNNDEIQNRWTDNPCDNLQSVVHEITNDVVSSSLSDINFDSSVLLTPQFKFLGMRIQSPQFSESERKFLLKTLGMESPSPNQRANSSKAPACKRALLQSL